MEVVTQTPINASREAAWAVLSDLQQWDSWQDILTDVRIAEIAPGAALTFRIQLGQAAWSRAPVDADVLWVRPGAGFAWMGPRNRLMKHAMAGEHWFMLEDHGAQSCTFHHGERFTGGLAPAARLLAKARVETMYADFNRRFKARVEG